MKPAAATVHQLPRKRKYPEPVPPIRRISHEPLPEQAGLSERTQRNLIGVAIFKTTWGMG